MLVAALGGDHYWNERVILLPYRTIALLLQAVNDVFPDVVWLDDTYCVAFTLDDAVARADPAPSYPLENLYHRVDQVFRDFMYFGYRHDNSRLAHAHHSHEVQGGQL